MSYLFLIIVIVAVILILCLAAFSNFCLDNEHYDRLKWLAMKWHYITAFVALLVKLFEFPYGMETVMVVAGIGALIAGLLGVSTKNYDADEELDWYDDDDDDDIEYDPDEDANEDGDE